MANSPSNFLIAGNDEHGINPPTPGKRTPMMPYIDRQIYENEWNYAVKNAFLADCLRIGFNVFDVKPNRQDLPINNRVNAVNRVNPSCLVTFAYNAFGDGTTFNQANGLEVFYSPNNQFAQRSLNLSNAVYNEILNDTRLNGRGVKTLDVALLSIFSSLPPDIFSNEVDKTVIPNKKNANPPNNLNIEKISINYLLVNY